MSMPQAPVGKIGIVTIIDYKNYGNRLQNYAVQQVLRGLGFECETIVNSPRASLAPDKRWTGSAKGEIRMKLHAGRASRIAERWRLEGPTQFFAHLFGKLRRSIAPTEADKQGSALLSRLKAEKRTICRAWSRAHIAETDFVVYRDTAAEHLDAGYDFFVVGSDQVWNPYLRRLSRTEFLTFASPHKRIAFSASVGIAEMPRAYRAVYREGLSGFAHISVREDAAAAIVHDLTGRRVPVTVDPTMLLTADDWMRLAADHPAKPGEPYLLTYFFGQRPRSYQRLIDDCVARRGFDVVHLNDRASPHTYTVDPAAFLGFIRGASLLMTDSFHGVIFAVLLGTPFISFPKLDRNARTDSRMDTLLRTLELEHRQFRKNMTPAELDALLAADYSHTEQILERKRSEALNYLNIALGRGRAAASPAR